MDPFATSHFSHQDLLRDLKAQDARNRATTAVLLSRIAEVDERRLYRDEGHPSMYEYLVGELHYTEGTAYKRLNAARAARRFPAIFVAIAEGRLHLSGVVMLAAYLTSGNADELLAAATHKTRAEIEQLIAQRFPRPDLPERLQAMPLVAVATPTTTPMHPYLESPASSPAGQLSPGKVDASSIATAQPSSKPACHSSPGNVGGWAPPARMTPLAPQRFGLQVTIEQSTYQKLQYARELLGHRLPAGEIAAVLDRALDALIAALEKDKFAATSRPRAGGPHSSTNPRHIPAEVKHRVWERDGGQCTFTSASGHRCTARSRLEYDHIEPVARGGAATVENLHLVCSSHNQLLAERTFGTDFIVDKRREARRAAQIRRREHPTPRADGSPATAT